MGKKDKKLDLAKLQAKKVRQAQKQQKTDTKRTKKELKDAGEVDIGAIIAEYSAKEKKKTIVTVSICPQPSRRANFSMTALPNGEMLMFGGEYCDGESTEVYNDMYRWNVEKNEWRQIESLNTPPPRCSHQTVLYNDKIYMFGGEFATLDQFYHYRDFWELDLKTNSWTELNCSGDVPTARSGHRMVVWRNYLILFGGFYEAMREVKWYNDLFVYSFQERKWNTVLYKQHAAIPKPRSGVLMFLHNAEDCLYIFGGYSKHKEGSKQEGKIHEDMWMLSLRPAITGGKGASLDLSKLAWQKLSRKGDYPSARCGATAGMYKNKALIFGGVCDSEGPRHSIVSTFYDELFAFDMDRKRWYKLGTKQLKQKGEVDKKILNSSKADDQDHSDDSGGEGECDNEQPTEMESTTLKSELFGYIDEFGAVVYIELNDFDEPNLDIGPISDDPNYGINLNSAISPNSDIGHESVDDLALNLEKELGIQVDVIGMSETSKDILPETTVETTNLATEVTPDFNVEVPVVVSTNTATFFETLKQPCSRINPSLLIRGNTLLVYGGVTELGDVEVTLDDCWSLDLNKRDQWKKVVAGTMSTLVWKGTNDDDSASNHTGSVGDDSEDSGSDSESDEEDIDGDDDEEVEAKVTFSGSSRKVEMEMLRAHFDTTDESRTPRNGETLRDFYSRTSEYWMAEVVSNWQLKNSGEIQKDAILSEKEVKRQAFLNSEARYQELLPLLSRFNALESEQMADEQRHNSNGKSKPSKSGKRG